MPGIYNTPGVYVEEIPKFPPSIAPVETAIPAFIGYTEKADELAPDDLINVPKRIASIADFELLFGTGFKPAIQEVRLDSQGYFKKASFTKRFFLYDSLRLFYANGGGDCFIVSVGKYSETPSKTNVLAGMLALEKYDAPTILLFPDAALLSGNELYEVQTAALAQCEKLKDRVGVFDLKEDDSKGDHFRSNSGVNNLKYGMAYTPWLRTSLLKNYTYRSINTASQIKKESAPNSGTFNDISLNALTSDTGVLRTLSNLEKVMGDVDGIKAINAPAELDKLDIQYSTLRNTYLAGKTVGNFTALTDFFFEIARAVDSLVVPGGTQIENTDLLNAVKLAVSSLKPAYVKLIGYDKEAANEISGNAYTVQFSTGTVPSAMEWGAVFAGSSPVASDIMTGATDPERMDSVLDDLDAAFQQINGIVVGSIWKAALEYEKALNDALYASFPQYRAIINGIEADAAKLPPSGPITGLFALVDNQRGVWKAPANVSVTGVEPTNIFTATELERLNVDTTAGKSINVIRAFTGKGILLYGARTLAGNDNEWRYVSVRRFFNFVEESVKKATEQFVFEPNDGNTWVRVRAMIENFLTNLWRQGALQGTKPEHAFYVAVGLGTTMTPLDILEGRMIIEIGMAAVRPAEFIVLKFSHKMAES